MFRGGGGLQADPGLLDTTIYNYLVESASENENGLLLDSKDA